MHLSYDLRVREILAKLVSFDTTSSKPNTDLIGYIEDYLAGYGIASQRFSAEDSTVKACLWATIGPDDHGGYILSGHTDVVPVDGQAWSSDPYTLTEREGNLYGRGAVDMKGFVAACLAMVPDMVSANLQTPIHLAFSYDEEVGCKGVRSMLEQMLKFKAKPIGCFVGEPTSMDVVIGHKGKHAMRATFQGFACHSSLAPYGVNAIEYAADLIKAIQSKAAQIAEHGTRDSLHKIPYSTGLTSVIKGGMSLNTVPEHCSIEFEFRAIANDDPRAINADIVKFARETIEPRMKAAHSSSSIQFEEILSYPALDISPDEEIVTLAKTLTGKNSHIKVAFGTEAGLFQNMAQIPTVVVGPGAIDQAHKPDEYISITQLTACGDFLAKLIRHCTLAQHAA